MPVNATEHRHKTTSIIVALLLCCVTVALVAILYLPGLEHLPLINEEPRRALVARTMLESGDYIVPRLTGEIYVSKPPLFNWLIVAASWPGGEVTEFTARFPSVVCLALLGVSMVIILRPYFSPVGLGLLAGALVLSPELMLKGFQAEIELLFTLLVTLSLWTWFAAYDHGRAGARLWLPPCLAMGLAFLAKGPPALLFFYLGVVPYLIYKKRLRALLDPWHGLGVVTILLMVGSVGSIRKVVLWPPF